MCSIMLREDVDLLKAGMLTLFLAIGLCLLMMTPAAYAENGGRYALDFDGVDDYVDIGVTDLGYDFITAEVWINPASWSNTDRNQILCAEQGPSWILRRNQQDVLEWTVWRPALTVLTVPGSPSIGEWTHLAGTYDGQTMRLFVNGEQEGSRDVTGSLDVFNIGGIGRRMDTGTRYFHGKMDEVRIWNRARSQAEIQEGMTNEVFGDTDGLVAYYNFNEGQGDTAHDSSPNEHHGAIIGATWTTDMAPLMPLQNAYNPIPAPAAKDVPRDVVLSWMPGAGAQSHNVYFGTDSTAVADASVASPMGVLRSQEQTATAYVPTALEYGQTYYWRVDEVGATPDFAVHQGAVWSFTVEPIAVPVSAEYVTATASSSNSADEGPEKTIDGSGLDGGDAHSIEVTDMWLSGVVAPEDSAWIQYELDRVYALHRMLVWNHNTSPEDLVGFGIKEAVIEYSLDGVEWTNLGEVYEFASAPGKADYTPNTAVQFGGVAAKYVRITAISNWRDVFDQYGLSEVQFLYIPMWARESDPAAGTEGVKPELTLGWRAGREAALHDVYLSSDEQAVINGAEFVDTTSEPSLYVDTLDLGRTYYWRVDEVNEAEEPVVWQGNVWNFSTVEYLIVDDFETYTNDSPNRVFQTWIDGLGFSPDQFFPEGDLGNGSGAIVGYNPSAGDIMEKTIVNSGKQSMPLEYNNTDVPWYSKASRTFAPTQDWTVHGADTLRLHFRGNPVAFAERTDGTIVMSGGGADIWGTADQFRFAFKQLMGNGSIIARVDDLVATHVSAKAGVMIRQDLTAGSRYATVVATPGTGLSFRWRRYADEISQDVPRQPGEVPVWVKMDRTGDTLTATYSSDGETWQNFTNSEDAAFSITIPMEAQVYIGLAVNSRGTSALAVAEFSNVSMTGSVMGDWQVEAIGVTQPSNDPASLYVAVEDDSGQVRTVTHPDPNATVISSWQEWAIPLSEFSGVDLSEVRVMHIGIGDPDNPTPDGSGMLYIDDIEFGRPSAEKPKEFVLQVNFGLSSAPPLDGFFRFVREQANVDPPQEETYATSLGDVTVTVSSDNTTLGFRTRATSVSGPCADLGPLIATELKGNATSGARLLLTLTGLPSGEYEMVTHHHGYHGNNPGPILILIDDESILDEPLAQSWGVNPEATAAATFRFAAEQGQPVEIVFESLPNGQMREPILNGFQLLPLFDGASGF